MEIGINLSISRPFAIVEPSSLLTDLASYYKLEDLVDSHGANTLTNTNSVTFTSGKLNNAATFDGTNNLNALTFDFSSGEFTISFWAKITGASQTLMGTLGVCMDFYLDGNNVDFYLYSGAGWQNIKNNANINDGVWHHIVGKVSNNVQSIIVDNGTPATTVWSSGVADTIVLPGKYQGGSTEYHVGQLDEMGFWNRGLTSEEITTLFNNGTPPPYPFIGL